VAVETWDEVVLLSEDDEDELLVAVSEVVGTLDIEAVAVEGRLVVLLENGNGGIISVLGDTPNVVGSWLDRLVITLEMAGGAAKELLSVLTDISETPTDVLVMTVIGDSASIELWSAALEGINDELEAVMKELDAVINTLMELSELGDTIDGTLEELFASLVEIVEENTLGGMLGIVEEVVIDAIAVREDDVAKVLETPAAVF